MVNDIEIRRQAGKTAPYNNSIGLIVEAVGSGSYQTQQVQVLQKMFKSWL